MENDERTRSLGPVAGKLAQAMSEWEIVDAHEHLPPEKDRVDAEVDVFTLFSHYTHDDLLAAGMSQQQYESLFNHDIPLERRWEIFQPYWRQIRHTSYARAALIAAEHFYGAADISDKTCADLSAAMKEANTPGIYERVLADACGIRVALTQCGRTDLDSPLLVPLMPMLYELETWEAIRTTQHDPAAEVKTLDDLIAAMERYIIRVKSEGAVGLKTRSNPCGIPDRAAARESFESLRTGKADRLPAFNPLRDYLVDRAIAFATEQELVIAVHTGYWGDFRQLDPLHIIPILQRHPDGRFDIYHAGFPWVREALMLGKGFPNVWLNFCWTHIISQEFAVRALDEALDLIPANKILAFGGDYGRPVEKVYGHLVMAREDVARALAKRVQAGRMSEHEALETARKWFWHNPIELYRLGLT